MIVLDASVMIAVLDAADPHAPAAREIVRSASGALAAHRITIAETLVRPERSGRGSEVAALFDGLGIGRLDEPDDPVELAELRSTTGLRMPDCCVLLAARRDRARLATFDRRLAAAARDQGVTVVDGA